MKKLIVALVVCIAACVFTFIMMNRKINTLQTKQDALSVGINNLSQIVTEHISDVTPLSVSEVETFQHNIEILNEFYTYKSNRPAEVANWCFQLKRKGYMDSSWIVELKEHENRLESHYCLEVITEDQEHYWFTFGYDSSDIHLVEKGKNREIIWAGFLDWIE